MHRAIDWGFTAVFVLVGGTRWRDMVALTTVGRGSGGFKSMAKSELMKVNEVASVTGLSARTVRRMLANGVLAGGLKLGRTWYVRRRELVQALGLGA